MLKIAWDNYYKHKLSENHRFPMEKYDLIPEQILFEGTVKSDNFFKPELIDDGSILLTHSFDYLHKLNHQKLSNSEIRKIGFPFSEALVYREKGILGGTYQNALYALKYGISMNVAGGTHHALIASGEGFCLLNDMAVAANKLLKENLSNKILIVDLDVHQGNGTAQIFKENSNVFTFSMHGEKNYPLPKEKSDLDIPLPDGTGDEFYLKTLFNTLPRLIDEQQPDFIFYQSGVDVLESDKLGRLSLSVEGCKKRDRFVLEIGHKNRIPMAVSMGGGYSEKLTTIVDAHANTFRLAQEIYF